MSSYREMLYVSLYNVNVNVEGLKSYLYAGFLWWNATFMWWNATFMWWNATFMWWKMQRLCDEMQRLCDEMQRIMIYDVFLFYV